VSDTVELKDLSRTMLETAARLYMTEAYGETVPPTIAARLTWPEAETLEGLALNGPFERTPADVPVAECDHIRLRLGNLAYPHMKMGFDRIPDTSEWVLSVDCHDRQLMAVVQESERAALEVLLKHNADVKTRIERRWSEAGLPTFERYIRGRLAAQGGAAGT
jgi:hypothetical protein